MIPLLVARLTEEIVGDTDMGNTQFLLIKAFEAKTKFNNSVRTTAGTLATLTASGGKRMYLGVAKISAGLVTGAAPAGFYTVQLVINGTVEETGHVLLGPSEDMAVGSYEFKWRGFVEATQTIVLNLSRAASVVNTEVSGTLECFEEDTGTTPQVPSITST